MPKKADDKLKTDSGVYISQMKASAKYDKENVYQVRLRVPKDWKAAIESKAKESDKSVNKYICDLIQSDIDNLD